MLVFDIIKDSTDNICLVFLPEGGDEINVPIHGIALDNGYVRYDDTYRIFSRCSKDERFLFFEIDLDILKDANQLFFLPVDYNISFTTSFSYKKIPNVTIIDNTVVDITNANIAILRNISDTYKIDFDKYLHYTIIGDRLFLEADIQHQYNVDIFCNNLQFKDVELYSKKLVKINLYLLYNNLLSNTKYLFKQKSERYNIFYDIYEYRHHYHSKIPYYPLNYNNNCMNYLTDKWLNLHDSSNYMKYIYDVFLKESFISTLRINRYNTVVDVNKLNDFNYDDFLFELDNTHIITLFDNSNIQYFDNFSKFVFNKKSFIDTTDNCVYIITTYNDNTSMTYITLYDLNTNNFTYINKFIVPIYKILNVDFIDGAFLFICSSDSLYFKKLIVKYDFINNTYYINRYNNILNLVSYGYYNNNLFFSPKNLPEYVISQLGAYNSTPLLFYQNNEDIDDRKGLIIEIYNKYDTTNNLIIESNNIYYYFTNIMYEITDDKLLYCYNQLFNKVDNYNLIFDATIFNIDDMLIVNDNLVTNLNIIFNDNTEIVVSDNYYIYDLIKSGKNNINELIKNLQKYIENELYTILRIKPVYNNKLLPKNIIINNSLYNVEDLIISKYNLERMVELDNKIYTIFNI